MHRFHWAWWLHRQHRLQCKKCLSALSGSSDCKTYCTNITGTFSATAGSSNKGWSFFLSGRYLVYSDFGCKNRRTLQWKNRPSNWNFRVEGFDSQAVSTVRWANENGTLSIAIDFAGQLPHSSTLWVGGVITLYDEQTGIESSSLYLNASFGNVTKELIPLSVNEIVSPMNLHVGNGYSGEAVTLSFGSNVTVKNAVLPQGKTIYFNLDQSFDSEIANCYRSLISSVTTSSVMKIVLFSQHSCVYQHSAPILMFMKWWMDSFAVFSRNMTKRTIRSALQ